MRADSLVSLSTLLGFFLTLVRVAGVFVFVPIPGFKGLADPARILLSAAISVALFAVWPHPDEHVEAGQFAGWVVSEAALGIGIGLTVAFALEAFVVGAQVIGLQAGYSFASTFDPATQADSTTLAMLAQTAASLLFFAMGLDREVLRIVARSMELHPPGTFLLTRSAAESLVSTGSAMFSTGLRMALPVLALMVMVDISLALLGRINMQLQLVSIAFPVKMLVALALLASLAPAFPALLRGSRNVTFAAARSFIAR